MVVFQFAITVFVGLIYIVLVDLGALTSLSALVLCIVSPLVACGIFSLFYYIVATSYCSFTLSS